MSTSRASFTSVYKNGFIQLKETGDFILLHATKARLKPSVNNSSKLATIDIRVIHVLYNGSSQENVDTK